MKRAISDKLLADIAEAFPQTRLTDAIFGNTTLWRDYIDVEAFEADSRDRSWDMLDSDFVELHHDALGFMTPELFVAVLPAYLVAFGQEAQMWSSLPTFLISHLTRKEGWEKMFDTRVAKMTAQQCAVILEVLEVVAQSNLHQCRKAELPAAVDSWRKVVRKSKK